MSTPVEDTHLPRYAMFRGRKVRIIGYEPANERRSARFSVIDTDDSERSVSREQLTFIKEDK